MNLHKRSLCDRAKMFLHYSIPTLLIVAMLSVLQPVMAAEGKDCGAYYVKNWGKSASSLVSNPPTASYKQCDVHLEMVETSWGILYRALIFIDRQLTGVEMVAASGILSYGELTGEILPSCFAQGGAPKEDNAGPVPVWTWNWTDRSTGILTFVITRRAADHNSVFLFVGRGGSESKISTYFRYLGEGSVLGLENLLGMRSD